VGVVTISREFAAVSDDFGARVARALGYHFVDKEFIVRLLDEYGMVGFEREYETRPGFWRSLSGEQAQRRVAMVEMLTQAVQALAYHGDVVIQGRSGYAILAGFVDVLHVRLQAPLLARIENIRVARALSHEAAATMVARADAVRTAFVEEFYGVSWDAIHAFDLVINTAKAAPDYALALVVETARAHAGDLQPCEPSVASITVDAVLDRAVSKQLDCGLLHR
jgi:cytidylate kinase